MIYFYDGSQEAFLTALWQAYGDETALLTSNSAQLTLGQDTAFVQADRTRSEQVKTRLLQFDKKCIDELNLLLKSGDANKDTVALRYFQFLAKHKRPVRDMLAEEAVLRAQECLHRVTFEIHRLHGFVRFMECEGGALYAPLSPDNDICDLLIPHFRARLGGIPFVLHDVKRKKAVVFDGEHVFCAPLERAEIVLSANETSWQALWKRYYASVNIPSRERLKQMRGYLPVRYWKFLPEKQLPVDEL